MTRPALPPVTPVAMATLVARRVPALLALAAAVACTNPEPAPTVALADVTSPAGERSAEPFLYVDGADRVHMTWLERTGDSTHAVRYARLDGSTWTTPATITERKDLFVNWADFPSVIAAPSGRLIAHWLQRSGSGKYAYDVRIAQSTDSGATWSEGTLLHRDTKGTSEHGFVAMWLGASDSVHAAWLDGRDMAGEHGKTRGAMSVRHTSLGAAGTPGEETPLDLRTCECCQVNAAMGKAGPIVVYRDRSEGEIRDIAVVRMVNGRWTEPAIVHHDNWHVEGCPVNGPAIAARGDTAVVAWFTGAQDTARVRVAWSFDGGATFAAPVRIDGGSPVGRERRRGQACRRRAEPRPPGGTTPRRRVAAPRAPWLGRRPPLSAAHRRR
ncbi:MAG: exo-alpha-sialidase [Cytophagaceae bacterium]|nr:exo-alpha-sialidase [Gemmatimonadaceae bacterium]